MSELDPYRHIREALRADLDAVLAYVMQRDDGDIEDAAIRLLLALQTGSLKLDVQDDPAVALRILGGEHA